MSGRPLSLFWRVFLSITIFSGALILVGNSLVRVQSERQLQRQLLANMQADSRNLALWSARHMAAGEAPGELLGDLPFVGPVASKRLWLLDRQGRVLFDGAPDSGWVGQRPAGADLDRLLAGSEVSCACADPWLHAGAFVGAPILRPGSQEVLGAIVLFSQTEGFAGIRSAFLRAMGVSGAVRFLLTVALALWLSRTLTRPLERLVQFARRLGRGEWDQRLEPAGPVETRQLAESLNQAAGELQAMFRDQERLVRMRENFVANVSHDLRAPLATLGAGLEAMQDGLIPPENQERYQRVMLGEVRRLRRLTDDLLELSRLDAGTLRVELEPVPLHVVTADLQVGMGPRVQATGIALTVAVPEDLVTLVDRDRLEQVLANLVDNALRFTPAGGQITIAARAVGEQVEIQVTDTGEGIDPESLPLIFDRFFKVDSARERKDATGTGLGLAIVQQLVHAMGGQVTAQSQEGAGSTFTVRLRQVAGEGAAGL